MIEEKALLLKWMKPGMYLGLATLWPEKEAKRKEHFGLRIDVDLVSAKNAFDMDRRTGKEKLLGRCGIVVVQKCPNEIMKRGFRYYGKRQMKE